MEKELTDTIVGLVESGTSIGRDLGEGARLLVESVGCVACSVYCQNDETGDFLLRAHSGAGSIEECVAQVTPGGQLIEMLKSGSRFSANPYEEFAKEVARCPEEITVCPLGSKEGLKGFLLLRGVDGGAQTQSDALLRVAVSIILIAIKCEQMTLQNESSCLKAKMARERLQGAEKFIYLGGMAAMLAHEIKNPLVSIGGFAARLKKQIEPGTKADRYMEQMLSEIDRVERIVDRAFTCTKDRYVKLEKEELNAMLTDRIELFAYDFGRHGISVSTEFESPELYVLADREQLKIAFDNLIANAIQSMERGGSLTVSVRRCDGSVVVDFIDTGGGIDPAHIDSVFTPFFTTKECGTGLGLSICSSIIRRHRGTIEVLCSSCKGTTFRVGLQGCSA